MFSGAAVLCTGRAVRQLEQSWTRVLYLHRIFTCFCFGVSVKWGEGHAETFWSRRVTWPDYPTPCLDLWRSAMLTQNMTETFCLKNANKWSWFRFGHYPLPGQYNIPSLPESPAAEFLKFIWFPLNVLPQLRLIKYDPWRLERMWAGLLVFKENQA